MNAFHVCGSLLALWALLVSYLGVTREGFPPTDRAMKIVGAISVTLVVLAIGSAIYTGATEKKEPSGEPGVILPLL